MPAKRSRRGEKYFPIKKSRTGEDGLGEGDNAADATDLLRRAVCGTEDVDEVKRVMESFRIPVDTPLESSTKNTALHLACIKGNLSIVQYLIEAQHASVAKPTPRYKTTPLMYACSHGRIKVVDYLLQHCRDQIDIQAQDSTGHTALHMAAANLKCQIVKSLLDAGADPERRREKKGPTPLDVARNSSVKGSNQEEAAQVIGLLEEAMSLRTGGGPHPNGHDGTDAATHACSYQTALAATAAVYCTHPQQYAFAHTLHSTHSAATSSPGGASNATTSSTHSPYRGGEIGTPPKHHQTSSPLTSALRDATQPSTPTSPDHEVHSQTSFVSLLGLDGHATTGTHPTQHQHTTTPGHPSMDLYATGKADACWAEQCQWVDQRSNSSGTHQLHGAHTHGLPVHATTNGYPHPPPTVPHMLASTVHPHKSLPPAAATPSTPPSQHSNHNTSTVGGVYGSMTTTNTHHSQGQWGTTHYQPTHSPGGSTHMPSSNNTTTQHGYGNIPSHPPSHSPMSRNGQSQPFPQPTCTDQKVTNTIPVSQHGGGNRGYLGTCNATTSSTSPTTTHTSTHTHTHAPHLLSQHQHHHQQAQSPTQQQAQAAAATAALYGNAAVYNPAYLLSQHLLTAQYIQQWAATQSHQLIAAGIQPLAHHLAQYGYSAQQAVQPYHMMIAAQQQHIAQAAAVQAQTRSTKTPETSNNASRAPTTPPSHNKYDGSTATTQQQHSTSESGGYAPPLKLEPPQPQSQTPPHPPQTTPCVGQPQSQSQASPQPPQQSPTPRTELSSQQYGTSTCGPSSCGTSSSGPSSCNTSASCGPSLCETSSSGQSSCGPSSCGPSSCGPPPCQSPCPSLSGQLPCGPPSQSQSQAASHEHSGTREMTQGSGGDVPVPRTDMMA